MFTRRQMLSHCSNGFGLLALHGVLGQSQLSAKPHYTPKAKSVIFCYMSGGVSQVDSFDPKPTLQEYNGKPMPMKVERTQFNNNGNAFPITLSICQLWAKRYPGQLHFSAYRKNGRRYGGYSINDQ